MSDNYNIKIGVDGRSAERGVKQFSSALGDALKTLKDFDKRSKSAFEQLNKLSNTNVGNLAKQVRGTAQAIETLNRVKVSRQLINNLQTLQQTLARFRFNADAIKKVPEALGVLSKMKIDKSFVSTLNEIKTALKGFRGPPAGVDAWRKVLNAFAKVSMSNTLPQRLAALKAALAGFKGPSSGALKLPAFLKQIAGVRISGTTAAALAALKQATSGFTGPSRNAVTNLATLLTVIRATSAGQINSVAAALQKMSGLSLNVGRTLGNVSRQGGAWSNMSRSVQNTTYAFRGLHNQISLTYHAQTLLSTALGSMTVGAVVSGIYETGSAFVNLERTLGAVATSTGEVENHMAFLRDLTREMPVSLDAAAKSYGKFAVAARLSGVSVGDTQKVFKGFSTAFAAMGVAAENQKYAFLALEQIFSKGTVSMEELRVQLGDHLPAAVQLLADSLGVPTAKLMKMIEAGEVTSDSLIKMADTIQNRFGPSLAAAMNSSQAQIINLQNSWTDFKNIIFDSGFNSGLGSMAKMFNDILSSDDAKQFAQEIGEAFKRAFTAVGALAKVLWDNREAVIQFFKAFAMYSLVYTAIGVFRLLYTPVAVLIPLFRGLGMAIATVAGGTAAIQAFFTFLIRRALMVAVAVAVLVRGLYKLAEASDSVFGTNLAGGMEDAGTALLDSAKKMASGIADALTDIGTTLVPEVDGSSLSDYMKQADDYAKTIQDANNDNAKQIEENAKREQKLLDEKAKLLSGAAQKVWDEINAVGKANEEYQKQLLLIDEIAKKRGLSPEQAEQFKKTLAAQTLDDRNPLGAMVRDYREELAAMKAKTGEQRALVDARKDEQELIKQGIHLNAAQFEQLKQYHLGIAKMNGEIGNGVERWTATVGDWNDQMQEAIKDGISGLSDELTNFLTGAESDFRGLARSILKTFVQISLDSLMKDMFTAMGMNGEVNGAKQAEDALTALAGIGETISTQMTNVYTNGLSINGQPVAGTGTAANPAASPSEQITRGDLPDIPGTNVAPKEVSANERFPIEGAPIDTMFKNPDMGIQRAAEEANKAGGAFAKFNDGMVKVGDVTTSSIGSIEDAARAAQGTPGMFNKFTDGMGKLGGGEGAKGDRIGYVNPNISQDRYGATAPIADRFAPEIKTSGFDIPGIGDIQMPFSSGAPRPSAMVGNNYAAAVDQATTMLGKHEINNNADVNSFLSKGGVDIDAAQTAWCAAFVNSSLDQVGLKGTTGKTRLTASSFLNWGKEVNPADVMKGDVLVNNPKGVAPGTPGAHVGFATGRQRTLEDGTMQLEMLGGNQGRLPGEKISSLVSKGWYSTNNLSVRRGTDAAMTPAQAAAPGQPMANAPMIDPTTTGSIDVLNQKLNTLGTTAQQTTAPMDQMKLKMTEAGTSAQTSGQTLSMANQTKSMSDQTYAMQAQTTGMQVQTAGMNAGMAGPQFQQAGTSIMSAGQQAAMAGSQAQSAQPGLGGFGQGISGLLGPLASAIPGLGQFGGMIMQLVSQLFSGMGGMGGGGMMGGLFKEGGYSDSPVTRARVGAGAWAGAPHYAEGTANTSGGMPAILHDNEAVIPLSRGRSVPVEMPEEREPMYGAGAGGGKGGRPTMVFNFNGVKDADSFRNSKAQVASQIASAQRRAVMRDT